MKRCLTIIALALSNIGCASELIHVKVVDGDGFPVSNAVVNVSFTSGHVVFGKGTSHYYKGYTGQDGRTTVRFNCNSSLVHWSVKANGFYPSESRKEVFKIEVIPIPPIFYKVNMLEHEKHGEITLYRKKNPQPMYAYSRQMRVETPIENGRYGFDLQYFDWLPPFGNGKTADFYYVRERKDVGRVKSLISQNDEHRIRVFRSDEPGAPQFGDVVGRIEFEAGGGAYVRKQTGNENFPATHCADLAANYSTSIPIKICENNGKLWLQEGPVITESEYMVIRSRLKYDEHGNVISANYSKIIGPWGVGSLMCPYETVFNPRPNDINLEFDPERNLYQGKKGRGMIP